MGKKKSARSADDSPAFAPQISIPPEESEVRSQESETDRPAEAETPNPQIPKSPNPPNGHQLVAITIPLAEIRPGAYLARHLEAQLDLDQRTILKRLTLALQAEHAQLANGKHVENNAGAIRWLLEQFAAKAAILPSPRVTKPEI